MAEQERHTLQATVVGGILARAWKLNNPVLDPSCPAETCLKQTIESGIRAARMLGGEALDGALDALITVIVMMEILNDTPAGKAFLRATEEAEDA